MTTQRTVPSSDIVSNIIYSDAMITKTIQIDATKVDRNITQVLEARLKALFEGTCIEEGFVKPGSIRILSQSYGVLHDIHVQYDVVFTCKICFLTAGTIIQCKAINITKAGVRAVSAVEDPSPFEVLILRDHYFDVASFNAIEIGTEFLAKVDHPYFEITNKQIKVIAHVYVQRQDEKTNG